jgi:hypothetical protein
MFPGQKSEDAAKKPMPTLFTSTSMRELRLGGADRRGHLRRLLVTSSGSESGSVMAGTMASICAIRHANSVAADAG